MPLSMHSVAALPCALALVLTACGGVTPASRVQEAAQDLNTAARFGRMDVALERVGKNGREDFVRHHLGWGKAVRIVDYEFQGLALRDKEHADVFLTVGWQRPEEGEVRGTSVTQHWKDHRGNWLLESEERTSGDVGLLGETIVVVRPPPRADVQFQSVTIR